MEKNESSLFSKKLLKRELSTIPTNRLAKIIKHISKLNSLADNKINQNITQQDLLIIAKRLNTSNIEKDFVVIDESISRVENIIKFSKYYFDNIKNIVGDILALLYTVNSLELNENDYIKISSTICKCVNEIDNVINSAYYEGNHLLFLTGVDKTANITFNMFESGNIDLDNIIKKIIPDGTDFVFCLPIIDTISIGLFRYSLDNCGDYINTEFLDYNTITNMEKHIDTHITKFQRAYKKILEEEEIMNNFIEILNLKKQLFNVNKKYIAMEYYKKIDEINDK